ncbi:zinc finger protein 431 [Hoplias malabaricus]|uniref:zinc finger protein 431 n=1 Tax=Hoplias malabaricus TaxID=27720 RepID=UPI0034634CA7
MGGIKEAYQDVQPVTLRLAEDSVTSHLYCSSAKNIEAHLSSLVEAFLIEVFRCRVCQFTSGQKARISSHVSERHSSPSPCPHLPCLEKEDEESLTVDMRVEEESELDHSGSPYDLHADSKNSEDQMDMERMSFLLPMYSILPNISPPPCDIALSSSSDGNLHVAQTCEVSTLFEEDPPREDSEDEAVFQLEDTRDGLQGPLSATMTCTEDRDDEMAQSAHLMTLGLCRISSTKFPSQPAPLVRGLTLTRAQDASDGSVGDKQPLLTAAEIQKRAEEDGGLSCVFCQENMASHSLLEVHLKCHDGEQGFKCPRCGWVSAEWGNMERHWRSHVRRRSSKPHKCGVCPRKFRRADSRDAHEKRHNRHHRSQTKTSPLAQCSLCLEWCHSEREWEIHQRCHFQGGFKCLYCDFTEKSWKKIHKHILNQHTPCDPDPDHQPSYHAGAQKLDNKSSSYPKCPRGGQLESWSQVKKTSRKLKTKRRGKSDEEMKDGTRHAQKIRDGVKVSKRKEFCCTLCDRKFSTKLTMRRHMGIHRGEKPFKCPQCHYSTRLKASLIQHLRVHTGEKPYKCPQCSYASIDRSSLRRHSRTHTQEKPYHCQYCPYSSIQKKSLDLHCRRHHTGESFPCPLCQYSTPDRQLLLRHTRKHHSSDQSPSAGPRSSSHNSSSKRRPSK